MAEYIECRHCDSPQCDGCNLNTLAKMLHGGKFDCLMDNKHSIKRSADVVSSAVLEQVMWERDMALKTLEEHGIGFCEKSDVVEVRHSEWKQVVFDDGAKSCKCCMDCGMFVEPKYNYKYCPGCGAKMDGKVDSNER